VEQRPDMSYDNPRISDEVNRRKRPDQKIRKKAL
jgi:hypothetical protein